MERPRAASAFDRVKAVQAIRVQHLFRSSAARPSSAPPLPPLRLPLPLLLQLLLGSRAGALLLHDLHSGLPLGLLRPIKSDAARKRSDGRRQATPTGGARRRAENAPIRDLYSVGEWTDFPPCPSCATKGDRS
eukprot:1190484-Prorocentrum_minimum.AAC.3